MTIENNTSEVFGSVCIRKYFNLKEKETSEYLLRFFDGDEHLHFDENNRINHVFTAFNFGAINYTEKIEEICTQATKGEISELQLTQKMAEIYQKAMGDK